MTDTDADAGWFAGRAADEAAGSDAVAAARDRIANGEVDEPRDWPALAVESGFAESTDDYYDRLHEATVAATSATVRERETREQHHYLATENCVRNIVRKISTTARNGI